MLRKPARARAGEFEIHSDEPLESSPGEDAPSGSDRSPDDAVPPLRPRRSPPDHHERGLDRAQLVEEDVASRPPTDTLRSHDAELRTSLRPYTRSDYRHSRMASETVVPESQPPSPRLADFAHARTSSRTAVDIRRQIAREDLHRRTDSISPPSSSSSPRDSSPDAGENVRPISPVSHERARWSGSSGSTLRVAVQQAAAERRRSANMGSENEYAPASPRAPVEPPPRPPRAAHSQRREPLVDLGARLANVSLSTKDIAVPLKAASQSPPDAPLPAVPAQPASVPTTQAPVKKAQTVTVNGQTYLRSALLGKGGSSRVYRITGREHQLYALKCVQLGKGDLETYQSFCNEIELLRRLNGHDRVIQLIDAEVNEAKRTLLMVLELGETDLNGLLQERAGMRVSMNFIRHVWEQMLECVKVVHDAGIVHNDLKPANFVLVKGALKLIDFGIAKAIPSDTTNIARDQQIGTLSYMSPEALSDSGVGPRGERLMKVRGNGLDRLTHADGPSV